MELNFSLPESVIKASESAQDASPNATPYQKNVLDDPNFLDDLRRHFWSQGKQFGSDSEMVSKWYQDRTYANLNSAGMAVDTASAFAADEETRARDKRLQAAYNQMPMFFENGGAIDRIGGWETAKNIVGALVLDPINLIPFGKTLVAAKMSRLAGQSAGQVYRSAALHGAAIQGAVEGVTGAAMSGLQQVRDTRLGLQDSVSGEQMLKDGGFSAVLGAGMGGLVGLLAARTGIRTGDKSIQQMMGQGLSADQILAIPRDRLGVITQAEDGNINRKALDAYMREQNLGPYAQQSGPKEKPSTDFVMEPPMTDAERMAATFDEDIASIEDELAQTNPEDPEYDQLVGLRNSRLTAKIILGQRDQLRAEAEAAVAAGDDKKAAELFKRVDGAERELRMIQDGKWSDTPAAKAADAAQAEADAVDGETKPAGEAQPAEAKPAEQPPETDRRTPFSAAMKARLQAMPEFEGVDIAGVKDAQKVIRRVAKSRFGIENADELTTDDLYYQLANHADKRDFAAKDMAAQAIDDYLSEVSLTGQREDTSFNAFLGERDTYAANREAIIKAVRESSKTESDGKQIVSKMLDEEPIEGADAAVGSEDEMIAQLDEERAATRNQARVAAESMRQGYESEKVTAELRNELALMIDEAKRHGLVLGNDDLVRLGRQARQEVANVETRNAMVNLVTKRGGDPLLSADLQTQWVINHVRNQLEKQIVNAPTGRKNIRGNTDSLNRQAQYATEEVIADKARRAAVIERQRKRMENMVKLPSYEEAKATVLATKQPTEFVADTHITYLTRTGEMTKARRGDRVFAVLDPNRAGHVTYVDTPDTAAILMGRKPDVTGKHITEISTSHQAPQGPSLDSNALEAPNGYRLALVSKTAENGKHTVRMVSDVQMQRAQAGQKPMTARNLLGKANADDWDVTWISTGTPLKYDDKLRARTATPRQLGDLVWQADAPASAPTRNMELLAGANIDTWENARTKRFPVAKDWQSGFFDKTGSPTIDRALTDLERELIGRDLLGADDMSVEGLYLARTTLDSTIPWSDPKAANILLDKLDHLLAMEDKVYPRGLLLPNGERVTQMRKLNDLLSDYDHRTTRFVWDTLNRVAIAHPDGQVPNFEKGAPSYSAYKEGAGFNGITVPDRDTQAARPRAYALLHELFHWGYANILTPSERRQFVTAVRGHLEAGTINDLLPTTGTGLGYNPQSSLNEIFAEVGAAWSANNRAPKVLDPSFWVRFTEKVRAVYDRLVSRGKPGGLVEDPSMSELFARILPDNEQIRAALGLPDSKVFENADTLLKQLDQVKARGSKDSLSIRAKTLAELEQFDDALADIALNPEQWPNLAGRDSMLGMSLFQSHNVFTFKNKDGKTLAPLARASSSQKRALKLVSELGTVRDSPKALEDTNTLTGEAYLEYTKKTGNADPALFMRDVLFNPDHPSSVPFAITMMKQGLRDAILMEHGLWVGHDAMPTSQTAWNYALEQKARHRTPTQKKGTASTVAPAPEEQPDLQALAKQVEALLEKPGVPKAKTKTKAKSTKAEKAAEANEPKATEVNEPEAAEAVEAAAEVPQKKSEAAQEVMKQTVTKVERKKRQKAATVAQAPIAAEAATAKAKRATNPPAPAQVAEAAPTPKRAPTKELADKVVTAKEVTKDIEAIADEMIRRARMVKSMIGHKRPEITMQQYRATRSELREQYLTALKGGDTTTLDQIEWVFKQRAAAKVAGEKAGMGRAMMGSEIIDGEVYQALKPKMNGKVATKAVARELEDSRGVAETGVMPSAPANIRELQTELTHRDPAVASDMRTIAYRLLALSGNVTRNLPATVLDNLVGLQASSGALLADTASDAFKELRNVLRRTVTALHKDGDFEGAISSVGHMVARALGNDVDNEAITRVFRATGGTGNVTEWFINQWRVISSGQKGLDKLTGDVDVFTAGKFNDAMNEFGESMAYVLRGAIDRQDIYQRYRWLGAYGDPLQPTLVRNLSVMYGKSVGGELAQMHAYDYLDALDDRTKIGMARWIGGPIRPFYVKGSEATGAKTGPLGRAFYVTDRPATLGTPTNELFVDLAPEVAEVAQEYTEALAATRNAIADQRRAIEMLDPSDVDGADRAVEKMTDLLSTEGSWLARFDELGVQPPGVQVVVTRARYTIDLTADSMIDGNGMLASGVLDMAERLNLGNKALSELADAVLVNQTGEQFVAAMQQWIAKQPSLRARQGDVLREFLSGMGFDSAMIGKGDDTRMAVFEPSDIRSMMDDYDPSADSDRWQVDGTPMRHVNAAIINGEQVNVSEIVAHMEDQGLARRAGDALMAAVKKRNMTASDEQALKPFQFKHIFSELSTYMRANKAGWVADFIKPEEGGGFFERLDSEMGAQLMPVVELLKKLEGNDKFFSRALNALRPNTTQPASFDRVVMALRSGDTSALKPEEVKAFTLIRDTFAREWRYLVDSSLAGEGGGVANYFPQVWDVERIEQNPDEFVNRMANFMIDSHRAETGADLPINDALHRARRVFDTLVGDDGVFTPTSLMRGVASEHIDARRVLRLHEHPGHLGVGTVGEFLQNDLEGVMVKYFQGTTRRRLFQDKFGQGNHAFHDFMTVLVEGDDGAFDLLTSGKSNTSSVIKKQNTVQVAANLFNPIVADESKAWQVLNELKTTIKRDGKENGMRYLKTLAQGPDVERRMRAIVEALAATDGKRNQIPENVRKNMEAMFESVEGKNPYRHTPGFKWKNPVSHALRAFNSITLLGTTVLSSLSDTVMPLVNSGDFKAYVRAVNLYARDPEYRVAMRNVGVAMENLVHNRMANLFGQDSSKLSNAFFNATLLTPWTDTWRGIAGAVAHETFKAEQRRALSSRTGEAGRKHAIQFLRRYGLAGYINAGDLSSDAALSDPVVRQAILRFTNESIFTPNPNDVPLWAKSPVGALVYQFKSFPMMMSRMALRVAQSGRLGSQLAFLTALPAAGAASLAVKDVILSRGGSDNRSAEVRDREPIEWVTQSVLQAGALGILADVLSSATEQIDNGAYGRERFAATILGPSYSLGTDVMRIAAGLVDTESGNSKERDAMRALLGRVPVAGRNAFLRENVVDETAGRAHSKSGGGFSGKFKAKFN